MERILSNPIDQAIIAWMIVAAFFLAVSLVSICLMIVQIRAHPAILQHPMVAEMKWYDMRVEYTRTFAQIFALIIGIGFLAGWLSGTVVAWALVVINGLFGINSVHEVFRTYTVMGGINGIRRLIRRQ